MAKYESPCQVVGLFAGAILVSCGVIYILTLEANKRYGDVIDQSFEAPKISGKFKVIDTINHIYQITDNIPIFQYSG